MKIPIYSKSIYREVLRVTWPLIISQGSFTLMLFFDRMFLAWYSSECIQAALPAGILSFTLICGFMAMAAYTSTFVAQFFGAGNNIGCTRATVQGLIFSLGCIPVILALIIPGQWILRISHHAPEILALELPYFSILMLGSTVTPLGAAITGYFTGQGRTKITMSVTVLSNMVNLLLDYLLIFGHFGFPELGIRGAAIATAICGCITPVILLLLYMRPVEQAVFKTRSYFSYDHQLFWRIIRFSLPPAFTSRWISPLFQFSSFSPAEWGPLHSPPVILPSALIRFRLCRSLASAWLHPFWSDSFRAK